MYERGVKIENVTRAAKHVAIQILAGVLAFAALLPVWIGQISGARIESAPTAYVQMSANLVRHGVISLDAQPPLTPSMYREPLPLITTALAMSISGAVHGRTEVGRYLEGERARHLKMQNVAWIVILCAAAGWAAYVLTGSFGAALAAALVAHAPFTVDGIGGTLDSLYTEQAAAAMLMLACAALTAAAASVRARRRMLCLAVSGVAFAALALIKAVFLYVFFGFGSGARLRAASASLS